MRFITFPLAAIAVTAAAAGSSPVSLTLARENVRDAIAAIAPDSKAFASGPSMVIGNSSFSPARFTIQQYDFETAKWTDESTMICRYDRFNRVVSAEEVLPVATGMNASTTTYHYPSDTAILPDTTTTQVGATRSQVAVTFDPVVTYFPLRIASRNFSAADGWGPWTVKQDIAVERDSRGYVTSVTPRELTTDTYPGQTESLDYETLTITYGADGLPEHLSSKSAMRSYDGSIIETDPVTVTDMAFDAFNGQIFSLLDLYTGGNRLTAASFSSDEMSGRLIASYPGREGSYVTKFSGTDGEVTVETVTTHTITDENGSYTTTTVSTDVATGKKATHTTTMKLDSYGFITESSSSYEGSLDDDYPIEYDPGMKGEVTYNAAGMPETYTISYNIFAQTYIPVLRMLFGYSAAGIDGVTTDTTAPEVKGIYDLAGRRLPDDARLAPGLYIIDGRKTLVK